MRLRCGIVFAALLLSSLGVGAEDEAEGGDGGEWHCVADPVEGDWDCARGQAPPVPAAPRDNDRGGLRPREDYTPEIRPLDAAATGGAAPAQDSDDLFDAQPVAAGSAQPAAEPVPQAPPEEPVRATPADVGTRAPGPTLSRPAQETGRNETVPVPASTGGDYVIQLMGGEQSVSVDAFIEQFGLAGRVTRMRIEREGAPWYIVVMGPYADFDAARDALFALPPELQSQNPWIRRLSELN